MPDSAKVVIINTTPLIALTAAIGNLDVLRTLYTRVVVPAVNLEDGLKRTIAYFETIVRS